MINKTLLLRNNSYEGARLTIVGSQSGLTNYYYTEANGNRYYYSNIGEGSSQQIMESATFNSFLSFTMSGAVINDFNIIPMESGSTVMVETKAVASNLPGTKGYIMSSFGGFKHNGTSITVIGGPLDYTHKSDFSVGQVYAEFVIIGTQSISLRTRGQVSETIDWDIHIKYTKGFHTLSTGGGTDNPIYTPPPPLQ